MSTFEQTIIALCKQHSSFTFPQWIQALKAQGVIKYTVQLKPHSIFFESNKQESCTVLRSEYDIPKVASTWNPEILKAALKRTQAGLINYKTFVTEAGEAGAHHYSIDFAAQQANYQSEDNSQSYIEKIPAAFFA